MTEQQPCIRCTRKIDAVAKICPYCNWEQSAAPPAHEPPKPQAVTDYRPPSEHDLKKKAIFAGAGALTLAAAFVVGMVINSDGSPKVAPKTVEEQLADEQQARLTSSMNRADTPLVAVEGPADFEQPITSAPIGADSGIAPDDYQRTDATAVSASDYAEMAKRAKAEKRRTSATLDPRSLTGPAYVPPRPRPESAAPQQADGDSSQATGDSSPRAQRGIGRRTRPVPEYQPLPSISATGTAKLSLLIGADGRVKEIDIERSLSRDTARLISSVRSWRFKPATLNGNPVSAPYSVEISFKR